MVVKDWTPEQLENAMKYGVCLICRAPREARMAETVEEGKQVFSFGLVCPNGHSQFGSR